MCPSIWYKLITTGPLDHFICFTLSVSLLSNDLKNSLKMTELQNKAFPMRAAVLSGYVTVKFGQNSKLYLKKNLCIEMILTYVFVFQNSVRIDHLKHIK